MKHQSYTSIIRSAVRVKWTTPELKEWWYGKLSAARRRKTMKLYELQDGRCCFCSEQTFLDADLNAASESPLPRKRLATLEHKITQKNGGTDRMGNLAMACLGCNNARGVMLFEQFLAVRVDPAKWEVYLKRRGGIKAPPNGKKHQKRKAKRLRRLQHRAWQLALLFYIKPSLQPIFEAEIKRLHEAAIRQREVRLGRVLEIYD